MRTKTQRRLSVAAGVGALALIASTALAAPVGVIDTFSDGTTMGWFVPGPSPAPPQNVATGGPSGAGDAFMVLTSLGAGAGPGGRLSVLNETQWRGDYIAANITSIRMAVNNFGPDDLHLRLLLEAFPDAPGPPTDVALTSSAVFVPAGSGWTTISFAVRPGDLVGAGLGTPVGALSGVDVLRIFHNPEPTFPGPGVGIPPVAVRLGVDNIAARVPEPLTLSLLLTGGLVGLVARRRR